jgi:hypothetical protein
MDTPQKSPGLSSIRTFAKDLEMKKQASAPTDATADTTTAPKKVLPEATVVDGDNHVYQAPTGKKRQAGPVATIEKAEKPKPAPAPAAPKKIPEPTLKPLSSPKSASEPTIIVDNEDAGNATIIRDTKHNRFHLFPAIGSSLKQWFLDFKDKYLTKKAPKYTVPETTLRKGVIQKATSKTGKIATFDHSSLQERIRERRDRVTPKEPTTTWTANTEPGYLLLEEGETISNVQVEPRKSFRTVPTPKPVEPLPVVPPPPPAPVVTEPTPEPVTTPVIETEIIEPVPELPVIVSDEEPEMETSPVNEGTTPLRRWLFGVNTNLMSLGVAGIVMALLITGTVGFFWFRSQISTDNLSLTPNHPSLLEAPLKIVYAEELTEEALHNLIKAELAKSDSTVMQLGVVATKDGTVLLPVPAILEAMDFKVSAVFSRSIATLYFGSLRQNTAFIVFKATDLTTARGGMLAWEDSLYEDTLSILAQGASARNLPTKAGFTDAVIEGVDTRVLKTEDGEEYLAYSLTKNNIVIITTTTAAMKELLPVLK